MHDTEDAPGRHSSLGLLVASPQIADPHFGRTVILVCEHSEEGTMGLVLNRPLDVALHQVLEQMGLQSDRFAQAPVLWGGPVMPQVGFLLCRPDSTLDQESVLSVTDGICISSSRSLLERAAAGALPSPFLLCLGYAGWGPGQLQAEISRGTWIVLDLQEEIVFSTALEDRWEKSIRTLGISPEQIFMSRPLEE